LSRAAFAGQSRYESQEEATTRCARNVHDDNGVLRESPYEPTALLAAEENGRGPDETRFGKREVLISLTAAREFLAWLQAEEKRLKAQRAAEAAREAERASRAMFKPFT